MGGAVAVEVEGDTAKAPVDTEAHSLVESESRKRTGPAAAVLRSRTLQLYYYAEREIGGQ